MNSTSFSFSRPFLAGLLLSALLLTACPALGQESDSLTHPLSLSGYGLYDFHYATGPIGGAALMLDWQVGPTYALGVGVEYAGHNRISANVVGTFTPKLGPKHKLNVVAGWNLEDRRYDV